MSRPKFKEKRFRESSTSSFIKGLKDENMLEFFNQFDYNQQKEIAFIYNKGSTELFLAVEQLASQGLKHRKICNLSPNDAQTHYFTVFDKTAIDHIGLMNYVLNQCRCDQFLTAFGVKYNRARTYGGLSKSLFSDEEQFLLARFYPFVAKSQEETRNFIMNKCGKAAIYQQPYRDLLDKLKIDKSLYIRWTHEYMMYSLIRSYYLDAEFQYRAEWLNRQSLDVFVPSIKTGFEYQGIQHFESVDFFGGDSSYQECINRDNLKKAKCKKENVTLIEWKYDEDIDSVTLKYKLRNVGIELPPKIKNQLKK